MNIDDLNSIMTRKDDLGCLVIRIPNSNRSENVS